MVKCLGAGIGFGLDRLEFQVSSPLLTSGNSVTDSVLSLDGKINKEWTFEETLLEGNHCIAIAYRCLSQQNHQNTPETKTNHNEKVSQVFLLLNV